MYKIRSGSLVLGLNSKYCIGKYGANADSSGWLCISAISERLDHIWP